MIKYIKETDNKGITYIIEVEEKPNNVRSIIRFICAVAEQQTKEQTQKLADTIVKALFMADLIISMRTIE